MRFFFGVWNVNRTVLYCGSGIGLGGDAPVVRCYAPGLQITRVLARDLDSRVSRVRFVIEDPLDGVHAEPVKELIVGNAVQVLVQIVRHHVVRRDRQPVGDLPVEYCEESLFGCHASITGILLMLGSVKMSLSSSLWDENSETTAPCGSGLEPVQRIGRKCELIARFQDDLMPDGEIVLPGAGTFPLGARVGGPSTYR